MYYIGQICGLIGTGITIVQPQLKKKAQMLVCTMLVNALSALNYLCVIGHFGSSVLLCLVAVVQAFVSWLHVRKETAITKAENLLFSLLYIGAGVYGMVTTPGFQWAISWANALELLPIIGALMLMLSVFAKNEQRTRLFLLCNGSVWLVYTAIIGATSFFTALVAVVSSAVAMWKYRKK